MSFIDLDNMAREKCNHFLRQMEDLREDMRSNLFLSWKIIGLALSCS